MVPYQCFRNLGGCVTHEALNRLDIERKLGVENGVGTDSVKCGCYLRSTQGLPCAHEIALKEQAGEAFFTDDIHVFWRAISQEGPLPTDLNPDHLREQISRFENIVEEVKKRPIQDIKVIFDLFFPSFIWNRLILQSHR